MSFIPIVIAAIAAVIGAVLIAMHNSALANARAMTATPTTPTGSLAGVAAGMQVEVKGKIRAASPLVAAFCGRPVVYHQSRVLEKQSRSASGGGTESRKVMAFEENSPCRGHHRRWQRCCRDRPHRRHRRGRADRRPQPCEGEQPRHRHRPPDHRHACIRLRPERGRHRRWRRGLRAGDGARGWHARGGRGRFAEHLHRQHSHRGGARRRAAGERNDAPQYRVGPVRRRRHLAGDRLSCRLRSGATCVLMLASSCHEQQASSRRSDRAKSVFT